MAYGIRKCDNCGNEVEIRHKRRLENKNIFCCKQCEFEYRKQHNPNFVPCSVCGKLVYKKPSEQARVATMCCSYKCSAEMRKGLVGEKNPNYGNRGENNPIWKSDKRVSSYGYILVRCDEHPFANCDGYVFEHRIVAEKYLLTDENSIEINGNRYLRKEFDVHHIDRNRKNNSPQNLITLTRSDHRKLHAQENKQLAS